MKVSVICILLGMPLCSLSKTISLQEAIRMKSIECNVTGNSTASNPLKSSHLGKCLRIRLTNEMTLPQEINIEHATHFSNQQEFKQDLITTENLIVRLGAKETKTIAINALCGEKNNASPAETDTFLFAYRHRESIERLAQLLEKYKSFDNTAQQAMWCFTDDNPIESIYDTDMDTLVENALVKFVANEKHVAIPPRKVYLHTPRVIRYPLELFGSQSIHIEVPTTVGFYLTDSTGRVLETIIADDYESRRGTARYSWKYRGQLARGTYFFQMKKNGQWVKLEEVKLPEN